MLSAEATDTRRSVPGGVIMKESHCLKVWTKKQQVARSRLPKVSNTMRSGFRQKGTGRGLGKGEVC